MRGQIKGSDKRLFIKHLINDVEALDLMLQEGLIESGKTRIGAEQEFCIVDKNWRPSNLAKEILAEINDDHFTTEIARYNLEVNLDPLELKKKSFSEMHRQLREHLNKAKKITDKSGLKILLTGILPTIRKSELVLEYMTPAPRYMALNDSMKEIRGTDFNLHITGAVDELVVKHDSVLFEACNTSFQIHLQIDPDDFVRSYNWAQAIAGPVLSICTNSPLLLGKELWSETRIALFQQSIDVRSPTHHVQNSEARVTFGNSWIKDSISEIFKDDISRYKILMGAEVHNDSLEQLEKGIIPDLKALRVHNGTIYRWNRPCYGEHNGKAHIRIENRYIPSGPSTLDEIANMAFWVGLMVGRPKKYDDVSQLMDFKDAKANFIRAARIGRGTCFEWMGDTIQSKKLIKNELIPIARKGLEQAGIDHKDIELYLGVIEKRIKKLTGSEWKIKSYRHLRKSMKQEDSLARITESIYKNQMHDTPIHKWPIAKYDTGDDTKDLKVADLMSTSMFTVNENDLADLVSRIMLWKNIHHVPVENNRGELVGLLSWKNMLDFIEKDTKALTSVNDIMIKEVIVASPQESIFEAKEIMISNGFGCLPVTSGSKLLGILTKTDLHEMSNGTSIQ